MDSKAIAQKAKYFHTLADAVMEEQDRAEHAYWRAASPLYLTAAIYSVAEQLALIHESASEPFEDSVSDLKEKVVRLLDKIKALEPDLPPTVTQ